LPIVALVRPANIPSLRTAERAGLARQPGLDDAEHAVLALGWDAR
jgi:RimJ/RimL family protein N-acetyltransferase